MKKQFLSFGLMLLSGVAMAQYPTNGLVAYFPLDGNGDAAAPSTINASSTSATAGTDRNGAAGMCMDFNPANSTEISYSLADHPELKVTGDFTIGFWAKSNALNTNLPTWISIGDRVDFRLQTTGFGAIQAVLYVNGAYVTAASSFGSLVVQESLSWTHFVMKQEGNYVTLYQDGIEMFGDQAATSGVVDYQPSDAFMRLGTGADLNSVKYFNGQLDDVFIYDRALTDEEIIDLYEFNTLPTFTLQPSSQQFPCANGQSVELNVEVVGAASIQWMLDGQDILGANAESHAFTLTSSTVGNYTVEIIGFDGSTATSDVAAITLENIVLSYDPISYTLNASHPTYTRWRLFRDGNQIATANSGTLQYVIDQSGEYYAIFDDGCSLGDIITVRPGGSGGAGSTCLHTASVYGATLPLQAVQVSNGQTYNYTTAPNLYWFTIDNATACGTTVNLTITDANGCWDTYIYNNQANFNEQVTRVPEIRCTRQTNTLNIILVYNENATGVICAGSTYNIGNETFTDPGQYIVNLTSMNGADSIVTLTLTAGISNGRSNVLRWCSNSFRNTDHHHHR